MFPFLMQISLFIFVCAVKVKVGKERKKSNSGKPS